MPNASMTIDFDTLRTLVAKHLETYAVRATGMDAERASDYAFQGPMCIAEILLWTTEVDFAGARQSIASLMFGEGFGLALRLVAAVTATPLNPDLPAIAAALAFAKDGVEYTKDSVRRSDEIDARESANLAAVKGANPVARIANTQAAGLD